MHRKKYTQTPLHTESFTQRSFYTQKCLHTDALHKNVFARKNKGTQALLHTEPFTQRNLCTEQILHKETLTQKTLTLKNSSAQIAQKNTYRFLLAHRNFTHYSFYTQKIFRTDTFMHRSLYARKFLHRRFYTQMLLHRKTFTHRNLCTQHAFTHNQLLHREVLLPLLDHQPFVFPLSSHLTLPQLKPAIQEHMYGKPPTYRISRCFTALTIQFKTVTFHNHVKLPGGPSVAFSVNSHPHLCCPGDVDASLMHLQARFPKS